MASSSASIKTAQSDSEDEDTSGYNCDWDDSEPLSDLSDTESESPESDECQCTSVPDINCEINSVPRLGRLTHYRVPESESGREKAMKISTVTAMATYGNSRQSRKLKPCIIKTSRRSRSHRKRFTSPVDQQKPVVGSWAWKRDKELRMRKRQREFKILQLKRATLRRHMRYRMLQHQYDYYLKLDKRRKRLVIIRGCIRYFMLLVTVLLAIGVSLEFLQCILSIPDVICWLYSSFRG